MFEEVFKERIILEGIQPERAVSRLSKEGICVFHAKKLKKNQILLSVKRKDLEKVFAIYPNICYNRNGRALFSAYTVRPAGAVGAYKLWALAVKRAGLALGAALFLFATLSVDKTVLKIEKTGAESYAREVTEILARHGVKKFSAYPKNKADEICADLLSLEGVSYCSVKKRGVTLTVELRLSPFAAAKPVEGDMRAAHTGTLVSVAVLRGTLLKNVGDAVSAGDALVGAYFLKEDGSRVAVEAIARVKIACRYEERFFVNSAEEAFAAALLAVDGEIKESAVTETENGYLVKIGYEVTETINF